LSRHEDISLEKIINVITTRILGKNSDDEAAISTVDVANRILGKSLSTLRNTLMLLKLPKEIRQAVKTGQIGVSQDYIFAANLDNPPLMKIFNDVIDKPLTNDQLKMNLVTASQTGKTKAAWSPQPIKNLCAKVKSVRSMLEIGVAKVAVKEMTDLLADLQSLTQLIQADLDRQANKSAQVAATKEAAAQVAAVKAAEKQRAREAAATEAQPASDATVAAPDVEPAPTAVKKAKTTEKKKPAKKKILL
jgi:hypothetical protein